MVDFPKEEIRILTFHEAEETTEPLAVLPLSTIPTRTALRESRFGRKNTSKGYPVK